MIEYYSAIKRNETVPFIATQVNLEIIIRREGSQTNTNIVLSLI